MENRIVEFLRKYKNYMKFLVKAILTYTLETQDLTFYTVFIKIYKAFVDGVLPFHLMLPAIGTPSYQIVKTFLPFLEPVTNKNYTIKDPFLFREEVKHFNLSFTMARFTTFPCMK